jgi:hypothetical protein
LAVFDSITNSGARPEAIRPIAATEPWSAARIRQ